MTTLIAAKDEQLKREIHDLSELVGDNTAQHLVDNHFRSVSSGSMRVGVVHLAEEYQITGRLLVTAMSDSLAARVGTRWSPRFGAA